MGPLIRCGSPDFKAPRANPRQTTLQYVIFTIVLVIAFDFFLSGKLSICYETDCFLVKGGLTNEYVDFANITGIEWRSSDFGPGSRVSGIWAKNYIAGRFAGDSLPGEYFYYEDKGYVGDVLIISYGGEHMVIGTNSFDMRQLYDTVLSQTGPEIGRNG